MFSSHIVLTFWLSRICRPVIHNSSLRISCLMSAQIDSLAFFVVDIEFQGQLNILVREFVIGREHHSSHVKYIIIHIVVYAELEYNW